MLEFLTFYAIKAVIIAVAVLVISAVVALAEKILGVDTTPNFDRIQRMHEAQLEAALHRPVAPPIQPLE